MTKQELVNAIAESNDIESKAAAKRTVELIIDTIKAEVANGNEVAISGLGKFYRANQKGRSGINPLNGEKYQTEDKFVPRFRAAKQFKQAVL